MTAPTTRPPRPPRRTGRRRSQPFAAPLPGPVGGSGAQDSRTGEPQNGAGNTGPNGSVVPAMSLPGGPTADPRAAGRDPVSGRFVAGNRHSLRHGLRSEKFHRELLAAARASMREHAQAIRADLGRDDVSRLKGDLIARYCELHVLADSLAAHVFASGPLTGKGRTRASTTTLLLLVDRLAKLAQSIGLERRQRAVNLTEYLAAKYREASGAPQGAREAAQASVTGAAGDRRASESPAATAGAPEEPPC